MKISELRKWGCKVGREGMSLEAQKAIEEYDGSYKGVMALCGKLSLIAKAAACDEYWQEQVNKGVMLQEFDIQKELEK